MGDVTPTLYDKERLQLIKGNLAIFLNNLSQQVQKDEVDEEKMRQIIEFYALYNFSNQPKTEWNDLKKFLTMGWYIYTILCSID